ncbi:Protein MLTN-5, partial [Aphelenchoides avenae]
MGAGTTTEVPRTVVEDGVMKVPLKTEHGIEIYQRWANQMLSSLFSAVADSKLRKNSKYVADEYGECSKDAKSVPVHAECLSKLLKGQISGRKYFLKDKEEMRKMSARFMRYQHHRGVGATLKDWVGGFRVSSRQKRAIAKRNNYELKLPGTGLSPLGAVAKLLMQSVLASKNKTEVTPWQRTVGRLRETYKKRRELKKKKETKSEEDLQSFVFKGMQKQQMKGMSADDINDVVEDPKKLKKFLAERKLKGNKDPIEKLLNLVRDGVKMGYSIAGQNVSDFDEKALK